MGPRQVGKKAIWCRERRWSHVPLPPQYFGIASRASDPACGQRTIKSNFTRRLRGNGYPAWGTGVPVAPRAQPLKLKGDPLGSPFCLAGCLIGSAGAMGCGPGDPAAPHTRHGGRRVFPLPAICAHNTRLGYDPRRTCLAEGPVPQPAGPSSCLVHFASAPDRPQDLIASGG